MNKKFILPIVLLTLVSLTLFVSAISKDYEVGPLRMEKGWNLVYGFMQPEQLEGQALESAKIKAVYGFVPTIQKYVQMYPAPNSEDDNLLSNMEGLPYDFEDDFSQTAFWVYSNGEANTEYWLQVAPRPYSERKLFAGWNFIGITPDIIGKTIFDIKGECDIQRAHLWQASSQEWSFNLMEDTSAPDKFSDSDLLKGLIVRVSGDCKLGASSQITSPPTLPELPQGDNTGLRKDIENYYYQEYSYEECTLNNAKEYTSKSDCESAWRCIAVDYAKLINEADLQDLADYMKAHGGEMGDGYYREKKPSITSQMSPVYTKCLTGKHQDY